MIMVIIISSYLIKKKIYISIIFSDHNYLCQSEILFYLKKGYIIFKYSFDDHSAWKSENKTKF